MRRWGLLLGLLLLLGPAGARAQIAPLFVQTVSTRDEVTRAAPGNRFTLTIVAYSSVPTTTVTIEQRYDVKRFKLLNAIAPSGIITTSAGIVTWAGQLGEKPLTLYLQMQVLPDAPAGLAVLRGVGRSALGFSAGSVTVRVCCSVWPAATGWIYRRYLPALRR